MEHGLYLFLPAVVALYCSAGDTRSGGTVALPSFSHERKPDRADETGGIKP